MKKKNDAQVYIDTMNEMDDRYMAGEITDQQKAELFAQVGCTEDAAMMCAISAFQMTLVVVGYQVLKSKIA